MYKRVVFIFLLILISSSMQSVLCQNFYESSWKGEVDEIRKYLDENPGIVHELNEFGYTGLMMVVIWGRGNQQEIIDLMIGKGADVNFPNKSGKTALHYAAEYSGIDMVKMLLERSADPFLQDNLKRPPFYYAVTGKSIEKIKLLYRNEMKLNTEGEDGIILLHGAASVGFPPVIDYLLKAGTDIRSKRPDGGSILHSAAEGGLPDLIKTAVRAGVSPDEMNLYRYTPLHVAVQKGKTEVVKVLLESKAEMNSRDNLGRTPYHMASAQKNREIMDLLSINGAEKSEFHYHVSGDYFGQKPPGLIPEIFAPNIVSTQQGFEFAGVFNPDGKEFYYTQRNLGFGQRIRYMKMIEGRWTEPDFAPFSYECFEFEPGISPDGKKLFYGSRRPLPGTDQENSSADIWMVERRGNSWSDPQYIGSDMMYVTVAESGTIYFTGQAENSEMRGIVKKEFKNGQYGETIDLGKNINFMPGTAHSFIAPDESYLIFDAQPNGPEAGPDLFISFREADGTWTKAVGFGDDYNRGREMCPTISPDGKFLFFSRDGDIFWVDAKIIRTIKAGI